MKRHILPVIASCISIGAIAQEPLKYCGHDEMAHELYQSHPHLQQSMKANRDALKAFTHQYVAEHEARGAADSVYVIPVVFHIIHTYGTENISDEQIMSGLKVMNWNFRNQNPDTASIAPAFKPIAADCEIEFRLAHKDPDGNCHSGINRIASTLTNTGQHNVKDLIHWDPSKYLNIYVVKGIPNLAGHCLMPDQAAAKPEWDGIVMDDSYVGDIGTSTDATSVVLAHEAGHYLNLFHIWGGNNVPEYYYLPVGQQSNCGEGDDVADTPPTIGWSTCNLTAASCGNGVDNVQNAMDYSYCNFMFTQGQRQRMRAALNSPIANRNNLITGANAAATGVNLSVLCIADFTVSRRTVCVGDTLQFTDKSLAAPDSWVWDFGDGNTSTQQNPIHSYTTAGDYFVRLTATKGGTAVVSADVSIRVNGEGNPFFVQTFENLTAFNQSQLFSVTDNTNLSFSINNSLGYNSNQCATINMLDTTQLYSGRVSITSPTINLSGTAIPFLKFNYAIAQRVLNSNDKLEVFFSKDCGTTWQSQSNRVGANLRTVTTAQSDNNWQPADTTQWRVVNLAVPTAYRINGFMFKIEYTNYKGNTLYLDNININPEAYTGIAKLELNDVELLPNPANNYITLSGLPEAMPYSMIDMNGKQWMKGEIDNSQSIDISVIPAGVYLLRVEGEEAYSYQRFVKL